MLTQCLEYIGEGLLHACISSTFNTDSSNVSSELSILAISELKMYQIYDADVT